MELGPQTKFVVFFSVAIGTPRRVTRCAARPPPCDPRPNDWSRASSTSSPASRGRCTSAGRPELERPAAPRGLAGGVAPGAARYTVGAPPRRPAYGIAGRGSGHHGTPRRHGAPLGRHANGQGRACARLPPHRRAAVCRLQPGRPPRGCRPRKRRDCNRPRGAVTGSRLWAATVFSRTYGELRAPFSH